jgi:hypothetical protein
MLFAFALAACSLFEAELEVGGVHPTELRGGAHFAVDGAGFDGRVQVWLHGADGDLRVDGVEVLGADRLRGRLPAVGPGAYALVFTRGDQVVARDVRVQGEVAEAPCARPYQANTQLSLADGLAIVDRFYADGKRERVATPLGEIRRLEYVDAALSGGRTCSAILLRKLDGAAVVYEDDEDSSLLERAETLALYMRKDLAVVDAQ